MTSPLLITQSLSVADRTLHTALTSAPGHFILHIDNCALQAMHLYLMLHIYNLPLKTSEICLSYIQDLHG